MLFLKGKRALKYIFLKFSVRIYDYKIEVIDAANNNQVIATLGETTLEDGTKTYKKGVAEPFIMLAKGYGADEKTYFTKLKDDLFTKREFRLEREPVTGKNYYLPKTIWDTALFEHPSVYPAPTNQGQPQLHIGQWDAYTTGHALFDEVKLWLEDLKKETERKDADGNILESPNYIPEHFYIYAHSSGAPYSRYMEFLINQHNQKVSDGELTEEKLPFVAKNIMLSPANCGSSLATELYTWPEDTLLEYLFLHCAVEPVSRKSKYWPGTWFAQPAVTGIFNLKVKPGDMTKYYFLGGHNFWGGGFGEDDPNDNPFINKIRYIYSYQQLLRMEADNLLMKDNWNDNTVTVKLQRGEYTQKVWNTVKETVHIDNKEMFEFKPNPEIEDHFRIIPTYPLNHYYGMTRNPDVMSKAWQLMDIPPRYPAEIPDIPETYNLPPLFPPKDAVLACSYKTTPLKTSEEKGYEFSIQAGKTYYISAIWTKKDSVFNFYLKGPDGTAYNARNGNLPSFISHGGDNTGEMYKIENADSGVWKGVIHADNIPSADGDNFFMFFMSDNGLYMDPLFKGLESPIGTPVPLNVKITNIDIPVLNAQVTLNLTRASDQNQSSFTLYDDGSHNDGGTADGIYGNTFADTQNADQYFTDISAHVPEATGTAMLNASAGFIVKIMQNIQIPEVPQIQPIGVNPPFTGIGVNVIVRFQLHNPYTIVAELFDLQGRHVAYGTGEVRGEPETDVTATIYFKGDDIYSSGIDGPYVVKNFVVTKDTSTDVGINTELEAVTQDFKFTDFKFNDEDGDGLADSKERKIGTDPTLPDTDNDGLTDFQEVQGGTDPLNPDTDGDSHLDGQDAFPLDPNEWSDRDGDGHGDNSDFYPDDPNQWENPNHAPVAVITAEKFIYEAALINGADINLSGATSSDPDDGDQIEAYTWSGPFGTVTGTTLATTLPLGETEVTLTVNDGELSSEPVKVIVKVEDTTPPVLTVPEDKTIEATALQTPVDIGSATATDIFPFTITSNSTSTSFPLGSTDVTWTAIDQNNNSVTGIQKITITDTTLPRIIITSPEARVYKDNEANPVLSFECSDIFGISEQTTTLNGTVIANGAAINLADLAGKGENTLTVTAKDANSNLSTAEEKFTVKKTVVVITPAEIIKFIDKAVREHKMKKGTAFHLKAELYLYQYFMDRAEYFAKHKNPFLARLFKHQAEETLDRMIRFIRQHHCKIDPGVKNTLILYLQDLKNRA